MKEIREALAKHLEVVREFTLKVWRIESGIYKMDQFNEIIRQPGLIVRMEMDWIKGLLDVFNFIQQYLSLVERWADHFLGLATNLRITDGELGQISAGQKRIIDVLLSKSFDKDYLHWVLVDVSEEMDRLAATTKHMTSEGTRVVEISGKLGGPFFEHVKNIALIWTTTARRGFHDPLSDLLQAAHSADDVEKILQQLGMYLEIILTVATHTPILVIESSTVPYSPKDLRESQGFVDQLIHHTENLREFIQRRAQVYLLLLQHEEAILRAILPASTSVSLWLGRYRSTPSKSAEDFLPKSINLDTLTLALQQAADALADWDKAVIDSGNILKNTLVLNTLIQSSSVESFFTADLRRLELYHEWRSRIGSTFDALCTAVKK
ncbi:MAG: hypothetical protein ACFFDP_01205 [Promethearchaeota archaeon]